MNNREAASFIILGTFLVLMLISKNVRHSVKDLISTILSPKILASLIFYSSWIAATCLLAARAGLWDTSLFGSTLLWYLTVGVVWFVGLTAALKDRGFFKTRAMEAIGIGAFFEFFVNLESMSLPLEVLAQLFIAFVAMLNAVAKTRREFKPVANLTAGILVSCSLALLVYTIRQVLSSADNFNLHEFVNQLALPIWLTASALLALYPLALIMAYEMFALRVGFAAGSQRRSWRGVLGATLELRGNLLEINSIALPYTRRVSEAGSIRAGREAVREFRTNRHQVAAAEASARERLVRLTGAKGRDSDGRTLDRREFRETKEALRWLATCHTGWYQREDGGKYRTDLLNILGDLHRFGLPENHGITMKVRSDGQSWYAYRRTPSGLYFAIGAAGPPPSQWFFDAMTKPNGFPKESQAWSSMLDAERTEWRLEASTGTEPTTD